MSSTEPVLVVPIMATMHMGLTPSALSFAIAAFSAATSISKRSFVGINRIASRPTPIASTALSSDT